MNLYTHLKKLSSTPIPPTNVGGTKAERRSFWMIGAAKRAPPPKPQMVAPDAKPTFSGNQRMRLAIGGT